MAAKIRLKKVGRRGQPSYRVVVLDGRKPRDAKVVADLGHYDPKTNPATFEINGDAALEWLVKGAKATRAARDILSKAGVMAAWDAATRGETVEIEAKTLKPTSKPKKAKAKADVEMSEAEVPVAEVAESSIEVDETPAEVAEASVKVDETPVELAEPEPEPAIADDASDEEPAEDANEEDEGGEDEDEKA